MIGTFHYFFWFCKLMPIFKIASTSLRLISSLFHTFEIVAFNNRVAVWYRFFSQFCGIAGKFFLPPPNNTPYLLVIFAILFVKSVVKGVSLFLKFYPAHCLYLWEPRFIRVLHYPDPCHVLVASEFHCLFLV